MTQQQQQQEEFEADEARLESYKIFDWETFDWGLYETYAEEIEPFIEKGITCVTSTPDMPRLNKMSRHFVFIYDDMKHSFSKHKNYIGQEPIGYGFTKAHFNLLLYDHKEHVKFPLAMLDPHNPGNRHPLYGELYLLTPENIRKLDYKLSNNYMTKRLKMPIEVCIDQSGEVRQIFAFVYIHQSMYWETEARRKYLKRMTPMRANKKGHYFNYIKLFDTQIN